MPTHPRTIDASRRTLRTAGLVSGAPAFRSLPDGGRDLFQAGDFPALVDSTTR